MAVYREKSTGKKKLPEAREYKHGFLEKLRQNQLPTDEAKWSLGQALTAWMEFRAATRPKASVAAEQTSCRHLNEVIGADRRLSNITAWDIRRYQIKRLETVGAKTVNNELLVLTDGGPRTSVNAGTADNWTEGLFATATGKRLATSTHDQGGLTRPFGADPGR